MKSEKSKTMGFFCKQRIAQPTGKPDGKGLRFFKVEAALKLYAFIDLSVALAAGYPKIKVVQLRYATQTKRSTTLFTSIIEVFKLAKRTPIE